MRTYLQGLDPRTDDQALAINDVLAVGGTTVDGYPILVQAYVPALEDRALAPDHPAFWPGPSSPTSLGDSVHQWVSTVAGPGGTVVTRIEVHTPNAVVGFAVQARAALPPTTIAGLTAAATG